MGKKTTSAITLYFTEGEKVVVVGDRSNYSSAFDGFLSSAAPEVRAELNSRGLIYFSYGALRTQDIEIIRLASHGNFAVTGRKGKFSFSLGSTRGRADNGQHAKYFVDRYYQPTAEERQLNPNPTRQEKLAWIADKHEDLVEYESDWHGRTFGFRGQHDDKSDWPYLIANTAMIVQKAV